MEPSSKFSLSYPKMMNNEISCIFTKPCIEPIDRLVFIFIIQFLLLLSALAINNDLIGVYTSILVGISFTITPIFVFIQMIKIDKRNFYLPYTFFLLFCGLYHGLGSLVYTFGTAEDHILLDKIFAISVNEMLYLYLINTSYVIVVSIAYKYSLLTFYGQSIYNQIKNEPVDKLKYLLYAVSTISILSKFLVALPYEMKLTGIAPLGIIVALQHLSYGCLVYFWYAYKQRKLSLFFVLFMTALDLLFGVLTLYKSLILLPIACAIIGSDIAKPLSMRAWIIIGVTLTSGLALLQPTITFMRFSRSINPTSNFTESISNFTTFTSLESISTLAATNESKGQKESPWLRMSLTGYEAYAIERYDSGNPLNTYSYFYTVWVPRALSPDKPLIDPGTQFNLEMFGSEDNRTGPTTIGEAYSNFGWPGVLILSIATGLAFSFFIKSTNLVILGKRFEFIPVMFIGMFLGIRSEDWAILNFMSFFLALIFYYSIKILSEYFNLLAE